MSKTNILESILGCSRQKNKLTGAHVVQWDHVSLFSCNIGSAIKTHHFKRSAPTVSDRGGGVSLAWLTSVQQRGGGVLVGAVGAGTRPVGGAAVGVEVDHEIGLLPAVLLQRPAQLFVGPDQLQHLAGAAHLSVRALAARQGRRTRSSVNAARDRPA